MQIVVPVDVATLRDAQLGTDARVELLHQEDPVLGVEQDVVPVLLLVLVGPQAQEVTRHAGVVGDPAALVHVLAPLALAFEEGRLEIAEELQVRHKLRPLVFPLRDMAHEFQRGITGAIACKVLFGDLQPSFWRRVF